MHIMEILERRKKKRWTPDPEPHISLTVAESPLSMLLRGSSQPGAKAHLGLCSQTKGVWPEPMRLCVLSLRASWDFFRGMAPGDSWWLNSGSLTNLLQNALNSKNH